MEESRPLASDDSSHDAPLVQPSVLPSRRWWNLPQNKHIRGFYCYSCAVEVYAVVSLTLFIPIALEQFAGNAGRLATDHSLPCTDATSVCVAPIFGLWINTASFSLYTYSISVALQAIAVIAISSLANDITRRSRLLGLCTLTGGASCILFLFVPSSFWLLSALFTVTGNVSFGCAIVCLNAYVPSLAKESTSVQGGDAAMDGDTSAGISKATSDISARGIAAGYAAGVSLLLLLLVPVILLKGSLFSLQLATAASGVWWIVFSIRKRGPRLAIIFTRLSPLPLQAAFSWLPSGTTSVSHSTSLGSWPWKELWSILSQWRNLPETFKYLSAWFIMSDAFVTITSTAVLFARTSLGMTASSLIFVGVLTPAFGIFGALAWPRLQQNILKTSNLATLRIIVSLAVLIPVYGLFALNSPTELLLLSCYFGALYGALQSYSRACFSSLIPPNEEARFFALYSITDKSSSFIGPALVAVLADLVGSVRSGFVFLVIALVLPIPLLGRVDMDKGANAVASYIPENGAA